MYVDFKGRFARLLKKLHEANIRVPRKQEFTVTVDERLIDYLFDYCNEAQISHEYFLEVLLFSFFQGIIPDIEFLPPVEKDQLEFKTRGLINER